MPLPVHPSLGTMYLEAVEFRAKAKAYGCGKALEGLGEADNTLLEEVIALASRQIDAYCEAQGFGDEQEFSENHRFNFATRRIIVNNPPVVELISFGVRTGPSSLTAFVLTPVQNGPDGEPIAWGPVYYNRQENYLELSGLSVAGNSTPLITLGLMDPQAEIKYRNGPVKPNVIAATGWQASRLLNAIFVENQVGGGIRSMSTPELSISFESRTVGEEAPMHPMAVQLLKLSRRIAIA